MELAWSWRKMKRNLSLERPWHWSTSSLGDHPHKPILIHVGEIWIFVENLSNVASLQPNKRRLIAGAKSTLKTEKFTE